MTQTITTVTILTFPYYRKGVNCDVCHNVQPYC